jgi:hypothetical protein
VEKGVEMAGGVEKGVEMAEKGVEMAGWKRVSRWRGGKGCRNGGRGGKGCRDGGVEKGVEMAEKGVEMAGWKRVSRWRRRVSRWRGGKGCRGGGEGCRDGGVEKGVEVAEKGVEMAGKVSAVFTWCQLWCGVPRIMEHLTRAAGNSLRAFPKFHSISFPTFPRHFQRITPQ